MKKNLNVIQIKGIKGILYLVFIGLCYAAGFGWFPGWLCMHGWNLLSSYFTQLPNIGIIQGVLLWAIVAASYFTFRKDKLVVCMKASDGLSEEELKAVFADMKKHIQDDKFLRDMMNARRAELKIKNLSECNIKEIKDVSQLKINDEEKVKTK